MQYNIAYVCAGSRRGGRDDNGGWPDDNGGGRDDNDGWPDDNGGGRDDKGRFL
ncbi:MAG: hypothetical protein LBN12_03220 [Clostridiales Family XIII bacterium]|nr:hypothetical protein [Clostridiales Family XIII bacterium]